MSSGFYKIEMSKLKKIKTDDSSDDKSSVKNFRTDLAANKTYPKVDVIMKGHRKSADAVQK